MHGPATMFRGRYRLPYTPLLSFLRSTSYTFCLSMKDLNCPVRKRFHVRSEFKRALKSPITVK